MKIACPSCNEIVEINVIELMEDGITRCPECRAQITLDDVPFDLFDDNKKVGGYKSASDLLKAEFDL